MYKMSVAFLSFASSLGPCIVHSSIIRGMPQWDMRAVLLHCSHGVERVQSCKALIDGRRFSACQRHDVIGASDLEEGSSMIDREASYSGSSEHLKSHGRGSEKAALVTPCLSHLPFHPSCSLGYGAAVLTQRYDLEVFDLNAELYFRNKEKLNAILDTMDKTQVMSDDWLLDSFYIEIETYLDRHYTAIPWEKYPLVYVTPPSWCPTVTAGDVLRLSRAIQRVSPDTKIFFFGNTLGTWTNEEELKRNGVEPVHLNDLSAIDPTAKPVNYDLLPTPIYENRDKYLFDLLPFMLNHGCSWGRCTFCSIARGWNSGTLKGQPRL